MKRVVDKVKDIVEVCPFTHLDDFSADPALTLAGYHFTDITSDLMNKWVDRLADVKKSEGAALALAGFRGVGKSHFLAVLAAIVTNPELRARIGDPHVAAAADRLSRRHNPVAFVRRGSGESLLDELKHAIAEVLTVSPDTLEDSVDHLLVRAADHAGDQPLVILVDTALDRMTRVARDDGALLSEIAEISKMLGVFVGIALDDDISGADGANSAIVTNFTIDYLDQEHLYKIVDSHIFAKQSQKLSVLHDIYEDYRSVMPGFRWSEQRFSSLYPLHPATLEIAPIIRLYIHDFALLGFASEAGIKIMGRPANSLIGLDEIFDGVEKKLRAVPELAEAFEAFDKLQNEVVAATSVNVRLHAKLILKGFLLLSLDGRGSTAAEIAASMMIVDEQTAGSGAINVTYLMNQFAKALPDVIERVGGENAKFRFKLSGKADSGELLSTSAKAVPDDVIWSWMLKQISEKFSDVDTTVDGGEYPTHCSVDWRGAIRRGEVIWAAGANTEPPDDNRDPLDWSIVVDNGVTSFEEPSRTAGHTIRWKFAPLTDEERETISSHHLLQTNPDIRNSFGEGVVATAQGLSIAAEKIWYRVVLREARLIDGNEEFSFDQSIRSVHSLSQLFTGSLAPIFEKRFTSHPEFHERVDAHHTSGLITNFFSGGEIGNTDVQRLAEGIAAPLGLAIKNGDLFVPTPDSGLVDLEFVKIGFEVPASESRIALDQISPRLQAAPFGLTREARQLVSAALVAQRQFEFVTSSGDRISHRSLDLQIIWDDIVGLAQPLNEAYPAERLLSWAKLITGNKEIRSLDSSADRELLVKALSMWLEKWRESNVLIKFDALGDEDLNAGIWKIAANLKKSYGSIAEMIVTVSAGELSVEKFLQSAADLFSDSEAEFAKKADDLSTLGEFIATVAARNAITTYLSKCEVTDDPQIELGRQALLARIHAAPPSATLTREHEESWLDFKKRYIEYFAERHEMVMSPATSMRLTKDVVGSDEWSAFESFASNVLFDGGVAAKVRVLLREIRQTYCTAKVSDVLETVPSCTCSFDLTNHERMSGLGEELRTSLRNGLDLFTANIVATKKQLIANVDAMADTEANKLAISSVRKRLSDFNDAQDLMHWPSQESRLLTLAADQMKPDSTSLPTPRKFLVYCRWIDRKPGTDRLGQRARRGRTFCRTLESGIGLTTFSSITYFQRAGDCSIFYRYD